jgi:glycosyltransferase involved in cell wall biosynthesis
MIDRLRARLTPTVWSASHWLMRTLVRRAPGGAFAWRVFDLLQKEGAAGVARRITKKVGWGRRNRQRTVEKLREIARSPRRPVVLTPTVDWEITLFQRPQQMALALGALGVPCLYATTNQSAGADGIAEVAPGCWLVEDLALCLETLDKFTLVAFSTSPAEVRLADLRRAATRAVVVYDLVDEIHTDIYAISASMEERHEAMVREADLVSVTADRLLDQVSAVRKAPIVLNPNACDLAHFRPKARAIPEDLQRFVDEKRPIIGYYGAIASWFDFELVRRIAVERPEWQVVLIGVDYDGSLGASGLQKLPNLRMLGPRDYRALPAYLACFDVATIPFLKNEITESTSPIKLFEYMAARKAIVTTDLRECRKYSSVMIGRDHDEFLSQLDRALARRGDPGYLALLDREAEANSWRQRAETLLDGAERIAAGKWPA